MEIRGDLTVEGESETESIIDSYPLSIGKFTGIVFNAVSEVYLAQTRCLQFIDPYGDTTFNMLQKPVLTKELADLMSLVTNPEEREYVAVLTEFVRRYEDAVHAYIKFHGD
jgi:hypothetical protein